SIINLVATADNGSPGFVYHVSYALQETSGKSGARVSAVTAQLSNGGTASLLSSPVQLAAGATTNTGSVNLTDTSANTTLATTVSWAAVFTDDNGLGGNATASVSITPPPTPVPQFSLVGFVRDSATGKGIIGAIVVVGNGSDANKTATTNQDGYYVFPLIH